METQGVFIVFEGGEGSGKDTQIELLKQKLPEDVVYTREPGGTPVGREIRRLLLSSEYDDMEVRTELMLFCADRANHIENIVRPALEGDRIVVSNRFDFSTYAYQIYGREHHRHKDFLDACNEYAKGGIEPDAYVYLDVDPAVGLERVGERGDENTRFDDETLDFHRRVREGYRVLCQKRNNCVIIDANRSVGEVEQQIIDCITPLLSPVR